MKVILITTKPDNCSAKGNNLLKFEKAYGPIFSLIIEVNEKIGNDGQIITELSESEINDILRQVFIEKPNAILVSLQNSNQNPVHEKIFKNLLTTAGYKSVYVSHLTDRFNSFLSTMFAKHEKEFMIKISAAIISYNEEKNIERCLLSLIGVVDEIVVVDSLSTDRTKEICSKYGVRFIENPFPGHVEQKNKAMESATHPYVLSLDADEELSPRLKKSILAAKENWKADGYYFNRLNNYCGRWIKHSGWYPDQKLRLWDRQKGKWGGLNPHDKVVMEPGSKIVHIKGDLNHYSYYSKEEFLERTSKYSHISAKSLYLQGKKPSYLKMIFSPVWRFIKGYILGYGFLGGSDGFIITWYLSKGVYDKYRLLFDLYKTEENKS